MKHADANCDGREKTVKPLRADCLLPKMPSDSHRTCEIGSYWRILLQKSSWGDDRNFSGPLMRFARGDMRDHTVSHKNDHGASYWRYGILRWRSWLKINICEIFGVVRFSTFATISAQSCRLWTCLLLCRFLDAGNERRSARSTNRRPKSAKARSRGKLGSGRAARAMGT